MLRDHFKAFETWMRNTRLSINTLGGYVNSVSAVLRTHNWSMPSDEALLTYSNTISKKQRDTLRVAWKHFTRFCQDAALPVAALPAVKRGRPATTHITKR